MVASSLFNTFVRQVQELFSFHTFFRKFLQNILIKYRLNRMLAIFSVDIAEDSRRFAAPGLAWSHDPKMIPHCSVLTGRLRLGDFPVLALGYLYEFSWCRGRQKQAALLLQGAVQIGKAGKNSWTKATSIRGVPQCLPENQSLSQKILPDTRYLFVRSGTHRSWTQCSDRRWQISRSKNSWQCDSVDEPMNSDAVCLHVKYEGHRTSFCSLTQKVAGSRQKAEFVVLCALILVYWL